MMTEEKRQLRILAEKAILENLDNEKECKDLLEKAWSAKLFDEEEINMIVKDIRRWNNTFKEAEKDPKKYEEQLAISKKLMSALGIYRTLALVTLIKQFPMYAINDEWFLPNTKKLCEALNIESKAAMVLINDLRDENLIDKKIVKGKGLALKINFYNIEKLYDTDIQ